MVPTAFWSTRNGRTTVNGFDPNKPIAQYDPFSGQVFTEIIIRAPPSALQREKFIRTELNSPRARNKNGLGARSLVLTSIEVLLTMIEQMTAEHLEQLPWHVAEKVYTVGAARKIITLKVWKKYATVFGGKGTFAYRCEKNIQPLYRLSGYINHINSPDCMWLTCLTIGSIGCARNEIFELSRMQNLVALDIGGFATPAIEDSIIKNWGRHAIEAGGFSQLQVLFIRGQKDLTAKSLEYLEDFPRLVLFGVEKCDLDNEYETMANNIGWTTKDADNTLYRIHKEVDSAETWEGLIHICYQCLTSAQHDEHGSQNSASERPLLNMLIGSTPQLTPRAIMPLILFRCSGTAKHVATQHEHNQQQDASLPVHRVPAGRAKKLKRKIRPSKQTDLQSIFDLEIPGKRLKGDTSNISHSKEGHSAL